MLKLWLITYTYTLYKTYTLLVVYRLLYIIIMCTTINELKPTNWLFVTVSAPLTELPDMR